MSEWWTYRPSDFLLFSPDTYYRLFELYNRALWPAHLVAFAAGVAILVLALRGRTRSAALLLAAVWAWVAWAFLLDRYATINFAARWLALAFAIEALLLLSIAALRGPLLPPAPDTRIRSTGAALILFGLAAHPLVSILARRAWAEAELFGMTPDPTAIATLGFILLLDGRVRWPLLIVPLLWCVVGGTTLWVMRSPEALLLPVSGLVALAAWAWRLRNR